MKSYVRQGYQIHIMGMRSASFLNSRSPVTVRAFRVRAVAAAKQSA